MSRPVFTKRHFEAIAYVFLRYSNSGPTTIRIAEDMADLFRESNERFDREKFLTACGIATNDE